MKYQSKQSKAMNPSCWILIRGQGSIKTFCRTNIWSWYDERKAWWQKASIIQTIKWKVPIIRNDNDSALIEVLISAQSQLQNLNSTP